MVDVDEAYGGLASLFGDIAETLFSDPSFRGTLQNIVDFAVGTIEGCDAAGISIAGENAVTTPVYSGTVVLDVVAAQHEADGGPFADVIAGEPVVYAEDLADEGRWPVFGPRAVAVGVRSLVAYRLVSDTALGALSLYAHLPRAFGIVDRTKGLIFATHAGVALAATQLLEDVRTALDSEILLVENLRGALASRGVIGQAEGILIERERITAEEAFGVLRRASQNLNIKLRAVATYIVETGEVPGI